MTALPRITAGAVADAVGQIARDGISAGRGSTKFCLLLEGRHYPPKYVVALAAHVVLGRALRPNEFSGGPQTNALLNSLGFDVVACSCGGTGGVPAGRPAKNRPVPKPGRTRAPAAAVSFPIGDSVPVARGQRGTTIVRVVSRGRTPDDLGAAERILLDALGPRWPAGTRAKFLLTPGGFVRSAWPRSFRGRTGWGSRRVDVRVLEEEAERRLAKVVTDRVYRAATGKVDVLTIGIDLRDDDAAEQAELVAVVDVAKRGIVRWTGKSYPTGKQERTLVHVVDLGTHLLEIADERVLVLGCHDLNMFSPRGHANQTPGGLRRERCDEMRRVVARFKPTIALQHPHSTDTPKIWRMPWLSLVREVPSIRAWASGIAYYAWGGTVRSDITRVLDQTRSSARDVLDIVVDASDYG